MDAGLTPCTCWISTQNTYSIQSKVVCIISMAILLKFLIAVNIMQNLSLVIISIGSAANSNTARLELKFWKCWNPIFFIITQVHVRWVFFSLLVNYISLPVLAQGRSSVILSKMKECPVCDAYHRQRTNRIT